MRMTCLPCKTQPPCLCIGRPGLKGKLSTGKREAHRHLQKASMCTLLICMSRQQQQACSTNRNSMHASTNINTMRKVGMYMAGDRLELCVPEKPSFTFLSRKLASMFKLCSCREQTALIRCAFCRSFSNCNSANFSRVATMSYAAP